MSLGYGLGEGFAEGRVGVDGVVDHIGGDFRDHGQVVFLNELGDVGAGRAFHLAIAAKRREWLFRRAAGLVFTATEAGREDGFREVNFEETEAERFSPKKRCPMAR